MEMQIDSHEEDVLKEWLGNFLRSKNYCAKFFERGKENYKLYKAYKEGNQVKYKHDLFVPYSFAFLEDRTAYLMLSVLASPKTFSLEPRSLGVSKELCMELEEVINWVLTDERSEFALELEELFKNMGIYNVGYMSVIPEMDGGEFDYLYINSPMALNIFPEPKTKRLSRSKWVIERYWEDWSVLKQQAKDGLINKSVWRARREMNEDNPVYELLSTIGLATDAPAYDKDQDKIEILDCYNEGNVIKIAGRSAVVRDTTEDPVRPYLFNTPMLDCRTTGAPGEFFGLDLLESMKPLQQELNDLRSQRRDNVALLLNKLFVYDILAGEIDVDTLFSAPGNVITVSGRDALDVLDIPDITQSSYQEEEQLKYDIQNITSNWDYSRGATPQRRETATGIIRLQQAAQGRNEWVIRKTDHLILQPLCRRILVYIKEKISRETYDMIVGGVAQAKMNRFDEFMAMDIKNITKQFAIQPLTESISSVKEININQFIQAFDRLIQVPEVNRPALIKQLLLKVGEKNFKEIIPQMSEGGQDGLRQGVRDMSAGGPQLPGMPPPPQVPQM